MRAFTVVLLFVSALARAQSYSGGLPVSVSNPSVGTNGATAPTSSTLVGYKDGAGKLQPIANGPSGLAVTGTVTANQGTNPWVVAVPTSVTTTVTSGNITAAQGTNPWIVAVPTSVTTTVSGTVAVTQSTNPWVVAVPTSVTTTVTGYNPAFAVRLNYALTNVATSTPTVVASNTLSACNSIDIFDSSGQSLTFFVNGVAKLNVVPGGNGQLPVAIAAGSALSLQGISGSATVGEFDMNCH